MKRRPKDISVLLTIFGVLTSVLLVIFFISEVKNVLKQDVNSWTEDHKADCAVVLTGSRGRVKEGLSMLARKDIKKLIVSGVYKKEISGKIIPAELREIYPEWPYYGDLNENDVYLDFRSTNTRGNALSTLVLSEAFHCKSMVLITTRLHMYRAHKTFKAVFPKEITIYKRAVVGYSYDLPMWRVLTEAMKSLFYSMWFY